jgi:hypothetical protein
MKRITVSEAKVGMTLARPITDQQGRVIVNEGTKLNQLYISRLEKWNIKELLVVDEPTASAPEAVGPSLVAPVPAPATVAPIPARALPPGVYRGPDLAQRIGRTFSRVLDDPLMIALQGAVLRQLAGRVEARR